MEGTSLRDLISDPHAMGRVLGLTMPKNSSTARSDSVCWLFSLLPEGSLGTPAMAQMFWSGWTGDDTSVSGLFNKSYGAVSDSYDGHARGAAAGGGREAPFWRVKPGKYRLTKRGEQKAAKFARYLDELGFAA